MTFNELLKEAGDFGLYQKFLTFGFLVPTMTLVTITYWTQVFILLVPAHRCRIELNETLWFSSENSSSSETFAVEKADACHVEKAYFPQDSFKYTDKTEGFQQTAIAMHNVSSRRMPCPDGWIYDYSILYPTVATEHDWVCDDAWKMYIVHTAYWTGAIVGYLVFGLFCDRYGRRRSYQVSVSVTLVSDIISLFASTHGTFMAARFFSAFGESNIATVASMLVMEYTGPRRRIVNLAAWAGTFTLVSCTFPWIAYYLRSWRYILGMSWIPSIAALILSLFIPESAGWLVTMGRLDEAAKLIRRVAKVNGRELSLVYIKKKLLKESNQVDKENNVEGKPDDIRKNGGANQTKNTKLKQNSTQLTFVQATVGLFRTPNMRKKTILLSAIWMITQICYNGNTLEIGNLPFNLYLAYSIGGICELPGNIFCLLTLDRLGRRWTNVSFLIFGGVLGILSRSFSNSPTAVLVLAMVMRMCFASGFDITFQLSSESFPTLVRGRAISFIRTFGGVASALAPLVVSLSEHDRLLPLVVFGGMSILGGVMTLFVPETAKQHLPHTLEEGEEFGRDQSFWFCPFLQKEDSHSRSKSAVQHGNEDSGGRDNLALDMTDDVSSKQKCQSSQL